MLKLTVLVVCVALMGIVFAEEISKEEIEFRVSELHAIIFV